MATVYVRYKQVEALTADGGGAFRRLNRAGLVLSLISSLGMCVVANFQVRTGSPGENRKSCSDQADVKPKSFRLGRKPRCSPSTWWGRR